MLVGCTIDKVEPGGTDLHNRYDGSKNLRVATTTSLYDTGLWDQIEHIFENQYQLDVEVITGGSGKAIQLGESGDTDMITIHDYFREQAFISNGYGNSRVPFAYNYFLIVGPEDDPAMIRDMDAVSAFTKIIEKGKENPASVKFASRGDESGTHSREMLLWEKAGKKYNDVRNSGRWYIEAGSGMGALLILSDDESAYTLTDIGTYLVYKDKLQLVPLVDSGEDLLNIYSAITINPSRHQNVKTNLSEIFIDFLISDETQRFIASFGMDEYGTSIFSPVSGLKNK
jgi:tungstate transport system substrate-binding protein